MKTTPMTPKLYDYVINHCDFADPVLAELETRTSSMPGAQMQISRDQGAFMSMLTKLMGAKLALEIGCYTGYSAISVAKALPEHGRLISLDVNRETSAIALEFFQKANVAHKIDLRIGPALETLPKLKQEYGLGSFDLVFIDADKAPMWDYYNHALDLLRPGGLVIVDNVIWSGDLVNPEDKSANTEAIRTFNAKARADNRVEHLMLHISDGLYLLRKKHTAS